MLEKKKIKYLMKCLEKLALQGASNTLWTKVLTPGGKIDKGSNFDEPYVYHTLSLTIEYDRLLSFCVDSKDLDDGSEVFRISVNSNEEEILREIPKPSELLDCPSDLDLERLLNVHNDVAVLRFNQNDYYDNIEDAAEYFIDDGIVISSSKGRTAIWVDFTISFAITTHEPTIDKLIANAAEVIPIDELVKRHEEDC